MFNFSFRWTLLSGLIVASVGSVRGGDGDWPQWRGPNRDGHAAEQTLLQSWPDGGPQLKWEAADLGSGYSSVAIVDGRVYTLGSDGGQCHLIALDAADGREIYRTPFAPAADEKYSTGWGGGTRSTPTIVGDAAYVLSDGGVVAAIELASGKLRWSRDLIAEFGGSIPTWGCSESVLVDQGRVMCTPGGKNFMIGLDVRTGEQVWGSKGVDAAVQYVSIMRGSAAGVDYYVTASKTGLVAFAVDDGRKLFDDDATGNKVAVIPTPLIMPDRIYHTSDYGAGNTLLNLSGSDRSIQADPVYHLSDKTMRNHHGGVVLVNGVVYGFTKPGGGVWMAQDLDRGTTLWQHRIRPNKSGSIAYADGRLYCYNDKDGSCYLVRPSREAFDAVGQLTIPRQTDIPRKSGAIWSHPVVAGGTLYIRDQDLLFAYDIAR